MSTFIGQLIGFAVIVAILMKWVVPLVKGLMQKQQEAIRVALAESAEAAKKLADADAMHAKALEDAKAAVEPRSPRRPSRTPSGSTANCRSRRVPKPSGSNPKACNRFSCCGRR